MNVHIPPDHTTDTTMLDAALSHAADGWAVFPCNPSNKRPLTANGFKDASTDPDQVREWWTTNPNAMIGMPTGQRSDVLVLDLDIDSEKGLDGIAAAAELGALPTTVTIRTPRGGLHCYFRWKGGLGNSRGALPAGIDVRGEGGYVIVPPSRRADGASYTWASPPGVKTAPIPVWLLHQILAKPKKAERHTPADINSYSGQDHANHVHPALEKHCAAVASAAEGTRNETLNRVAFELGQLVASGMLIEVEVQQRLLSAAASCGLPEHEAEKTISSGLAAGVKEPRSVSEGKSIRSDRPKPLEDDILTSAGFELAEAHDYRGANGQLLYQSLRYSHPCGAVRFLLRRPGPPGSSIEWVGGAGLVRIPYRLLDLARWQEETVYFTESEQDADRLIAASLLASTLAEQKWTPEAAKAYGGRAVVLVFPNDEVGRMHEAKAVECLRGFAASIRVARLAELRRGQGVSDWLDEGHTPDELREIADLTPPVGLSLAPSPWIDEAAIPPRTWLYKPHYISQFISLLISTGGIGKSSLAIVEALAMVSGEPLLGIRPAGPMRVLVWNGEDPIEELHRRFAAAIKHYGLLEEQVEDRLFIVSGRTTPIVVASEENRQVVVHEEEIQQLVATIRENKINVVIIDPFVTSHRVNENDNSAIERVSKAWAHVAVAANCAVMLVHHTVKPHGGELTVDQSRGASALLAAARSARVINTMSMAEAEQANIPVETRRQYFRADLGKANMMRAAEEADWFKVISIELLNNLPLFGDDVGVVTPWTYPKVDVLNPTASQEIACLNAIRNGGPWRYSQLSTAEPWVGLRIMRSLGVDPDSKLVRKAVVKLLKRWIESDILKVVEREDKHREKRKYVEVGDAAVEGSAAAQEEVKGD